MKVKFLLGVGALLGVAVISVSTNAEDEKFLTVPDLYRMCKSTGPGNWFCIGYIAGSMGQMQTIKVIAENAQVAKEREAILGVAICGYPSYGAGVQAFMNWAEKHPEKWEYPTPVGVLMALSETCRASDTGVFGRPRC